MDNKLWEKAIDFHGHKCPGLAIGYKVCAAAIEKLNLSFSEDENLVCITENDACGVDAIQIILGCSFGKGNLIYRGVGKQAFSFFNRKTNESIRILLKPLPKGIDKDEKEEYLLSSPIDDLFNFKDSNLNLPKKAKIFRTIICESCGEGAAENKIRLRDGKKVCLDCFEDYRRDHLKTF